MFTNDQRQKERTGKYGSSRVQYLQELVSQFQNASDEEPSERLVEFGVGGICNACADPTNAVVFIQCGGIPLVIKCLSSPIRNTVIYALGALYYLRDPSTEEEILKPEVVEVRSL